MDHIRFNPAKVLTFGVLTVLLAILVACGSATAPTSAPATSDSGPQPQAGATQSSPTSIPTSTPARVASTPSSLAPAGVLRIALDEIGPPRWIPKLQGAPQNSINNTTFTESLWSKSADGKINGMLLDSWTVADDGTQWTLNFRQGIPFHYGYGELTARDFIWTMENSVEEGTTEGQAENFRRIFFAEGGGMEMVDDYTVVVDTVNPVPDFNWQLVLAINTQMGKGIFSKAYFDDVGPEQAGTKQAVGTGPWRSVSHETGGTWKFEAVEDHWRKTPNFAELHYTEIIEESTRLANFQAGQLDTAKFNLESISVLEDSCSECKFMTSVGGELFVNIHGQMYVDRPDLPTARRSDLPWISASPDVNSPEWDRARQVRLAMNIAIDRELLVETLLQGKGAPAHVFGWLGHENRMGRLADLKYEYNPERAKELLAGAGYPNGFEINLALTNRPYPGTIETAEAIATMWEEIGIRTVQSRQPMSSFRALFPERSWEGVNSHGTSPGSEPIERFNVFRPTSVVNYGLEHDFMTDMYEQGISTMNEDERFEIARQMSEFLFDNAVIIPTVSVFQVWPVGPKIDEWEMACCNTRVPSNLEFIPHRQ